MPDWLSVSLVVSVAGVGLGLRQLHRTRMAAEAARDASQETVVAVERNLLLIVYAGNKHHTLEIFYALFVAHISFTLLFLDFNL